MLSDHDILRRHLLDSLGYCPPQRAVPDLPELVETEWSPRFEQYMRNRLIMGCFRYGPLANKKGYAIIDYIITKLNRYQQIGCLEALVDVANMALIEFEHPSHPTAHWSPLDETKEHCK